MSSGYSPARRRTPAIRRAGAAPRIARPTPRPRWAGPRRRVASPLTSCGGFLRPRGLEPRGQEMNDGPGRDVGQPANDEDGRVVVAVGFENPAGDPLERPAADAAGECADPHH